jgi:glycopeptide antibiotics resistance protein
VIAASAAAFIPVGMLLTFVRAGIYRVRRGLLAVTAIGLTITTGIFALSALVMGAYPVLASILYRTLGITTGAAMLRWLARQDPERLRVRLRGWVPWMIPPYLLALLVVNRLLSPHWLSPDDVIDHTYRLGLIPLFDYYIVSKAAAAKNIVGHVLLYMPVGAGLWLRDGGRRGGRAFLLAALLSFGVELARYFRPGLEGDINAVAVAGLSAMLAMRLMPAVWSMLAKLSAPVPVRRWDRSGTAPRPTGEIEEF